jgi:hypothetical protein
VETELSGEARASGGAEQQRRHDAEGGAQEGEQRLVQGAGGEAASMTAPSTPCTR